MPNGGNSDRHVISAVECIAKRRSEATLLAVVLSSRLGVVGEPPCLSAEGRNHTGLGYLRNLAIVGRVGLTGDDEDFAHANVGHCQLGDCMRSVEQLHFDGVKAASGCW